jgi:hypothetical protein
VYISSYLFIGSVFVAIYLPPITSSFIYNLFFLGIPTVVILHPPYKVYYGQTVTIHCQVTATPPTDRINWYKTINGTTTTVNTANSKYAGGSVAIPSLTITNANINDDEGRYICSSANKW